MNILIEIIEKLNKNQIQILINEFDSKNIIFTNIFSSENIDSRVKFKYLKKYLIIGLIFGIFISIIFQYYTTYSYPIGLSNKPIFSINYTSIITFIITIFITLFSLFIGFLKEGKLINWNIKNNILRDIINNKSEYLVFEIKQIEDLKSMKEILINNNIKEYIIYENN